jgi:hypothetical protein
VGGGRQPAGDGRRATTDGGRVPKLGAIGGLTVNHGEKVERRKRRERKGWVAGVHAKECVPFTFYTL